MLDSYTAARPKSPERRSTSRSASVRRSPSPRARRSPSPIRRTGSRRETSPRREISPRRSAYQVPPPPPRRPASPPRGRPYQPIRTDSSTRSPPAKRPRSQTPPPAAPPRIVHQLSERRRLSKSPELARNPWDKWGLRRNDGTIVRQRMEPELLGGRRRLPEGNYRREGGSYSARDRRSPSPVPRGNPPPRRLPQGNGGNSGGQGGNSRVPVRPVDVKYPERVGMRLGSNSVSFPFDSVTASIQWGCIRRMKLILPFLARSRSKMRLCL